MPGGNFSNVIAATVLPNVQPSVSISSDKVNLCQGDPAIFTATPVNGGATPGYHWLINSLPAGTDAASFNTSTLADGDVVSCLLSSTAACLTSATALSNLISVDVQPATYPSPVIDYPLPICSGQPVSFKARTGTVIDPIYSWRLNDAIAGSQDSYTVPSVADGDKISCTLSENNSICSRPVTVSVVPVVYPTPVVSHLAPLVLTKGQSILLDLPVSGTISTYDWSLSAGLSDPATADPLAAPLRSTDYRLNVVSADGCSANGDIQVNVLVRYYKFRNIKTLC